MDFKNKRVTVMGLGTFGGNIAAVRFLAGEGAAEIIVTDQKRGDQLAGSLAEIAGLPHVTLRLGGHDPADFTAVDAVVVSPAVPKDSPLLAAARAAGVPLTSEMNIFFERCPAPIVAITGSAGKSTTTAMIEAVLTAGAAGPGNHRRDADATVTSLGTVHLGGNIGHRALLPGVGRIAPTDTVVLELSSFQLEDLGELKRSPHLAVVTNLAPNHLDRHGTMAEYARCKQNILRFQRPGDVAVLNAEDANLAEWAKLTPARICWYRVEDIAELAKTQAKMGAKTQAKPLQVVGRHNLLNAAAALAVGRALNVPDAAIAAALADFRALPHRLELVGEVRGARYYNDSKATTPESTLTALAAFEGSPVIIIVGGYDKKIDLAPLCRELAARAKAVITIGQTGDQFAELVSRHVGQSPSAVRPIIRSGGDLSGAVAIANEYAAPGDVVLLSPASASYGQFKNYEERGDLFRQLVGAMK